MIYSIPKKFQTLAGPPSCSQSGKAPRSSCWTRSSPPAEGDGVSDDPPLSCQSVWSPFSGLVHWVDSLSAAVSHGALSQTRLGRPDMPYNTIPYYDIPYHTYTIIYLLYHIILQDPSVCVVFGPQKTLRGPDCLSWISHAMNRPAYLYH